MLNNRLLRRTAPISSRGGFTLVELLVVIGIIAILAGVALGPITGAIKQAQHNAAMQYGRQIGQMCFSYSTDNIQNGNQYPADATGMAICQDLLNASYATDPNVFGVAQQLGYAKPTTTGAGTVLVADNVSWSFACVKAAAPPAAVGINSNTSDLMPLVFFNNGFSTAVVGTLLATPGAAVAVAYGKNAPFGTDGAAIFYKGNNAVYVKAGLPTGGATPVAGQIANFISANCTDTTVYQVAQ
jgi:prepilin-type N-terminal cleavage/methylation domain-containing protein